MEKEKCLDFMINNDFEKNYEIVQGNAVIKAVNEYGIFLIF